MPLSVRVTKRTIDVVLGLIGIALAAPLFVLIALLIRLDSPGPVLYRQRRCGRLRRAGRGRVECDEIVVYKFRTMRADAEASTGAVLAQQDDPRVTRIGKLLRRTRLDELPQLFNVVSGSMSLVGPRPERPELLSRLAMAIPLFEERMRDVKPGITGFSQVSLGYTGRPFEGSEIARYEPLLTNPFRLPEAEGAVADEMRMKLLYDLAYAGACERMATYLPLELMVIAKTPLVMLRGVGR